MEFGRRAVYRSQINVNRGLRMVTVHLTLELCPPCPRHFRL